MVCYSYCILLISLTTPHCWLIKFVYLKKKSLIGACPHVKDVSHDVYSISFYDMLCAEPFESSIVKLNGSMLLGVKWRQSWKALNDCWDLLNILFFFSLRFLWSTFDSCNWSSHQGRCKFCNELTNQQFWYITEKWDSFTSPVYFSLNI